MQVQHFRAWTEHPRKFTGNASSRDSLGWIRFALLSALLAARQGNPITEKHGFVSINEHADGAFARHCLPCGVEPTARSATFFGPAVRLLAPAAALLVSIPTYRIYRAQARQDSHRAPQQGVDHLKVEKTLAKGVAVYATQVLSATLRPADWAAAVISADLSLARMWTAFAAAKTGVPLFLVFPDSDPIPLRLGVRAISESGQIAGCFAFEADIPASAGVPTGTPIALFPSDDVPYRSQFSPPWRLGILCASSAKSNMAEIAAFAESALTSNHTTSVTVLLHPSSSLSDFPLSGSRDQALKVVVKQSLSEFAMSNDVVVTAWTSAANSVARYGLPCWGLKESLHDYGGVGVWDTGRFALPVTHLSGRQFMDTLSHDALLRCRNSILAQAHQRSAPKNDITIVPLNDLLDKIADLGNWLNLYR